MSQQYDKEFKLNAVKLYLNNNKTIKEIGADLGISRAALGHWITAYRRDGERSFPGSGHVIEAEVQALKKELHLVRQERDILKKAIAIFSEARGKGTV